MSWIKKYAIGFLIALFVLTAMEAAHRPKDIRVGAIVLVSAVWPVALTILAGWSVGEVFASAPDGKEQAHGS